MGLKLAAALFISLLSCITLAATPNYYLSITGRRTGVLYHNNIASLQNVVPIQGFNFSATSPRDPASGLPTGRRLYTPVTVYKEMDGSSPLLMQIFNANEVLQATITATETATAGHPATKITWKLTNGALASVVYEAIDTQLVEKVSITFQKMDIDAEAGGKTISTTFDL